MAEVTFVFKEFETIFPIERTVSMENICQKYSHFINIPLKNLYFFYKANKLDLKLSFNDIAKEEDKINGKIIILVLLKESLNDKNKIEKNKIKANILYEELILKYDYLKNNFNEEEIINKIIEFDFNENKVIEYYDQANKIFEEMDYEYGLDSCMIGDEVKNKIRELHYDRDLISAWIEEVLLNNSW